MDGRNTDPPGVGRDARPPELGSRRVQLALGALGMGAFCVVSATWRDWAHVIYDIPASFAVFSFIAQLVLEAGHGGWTRSLALRFALLAAMTLATGGRHFLDWTISGHLSCVLAVALVQSADRRLAPVERMLYWFPLPVVLAVRWFLFDQGEHGQTYNALLFAIVGAGLVLFLARPDRTRTVC